MILGAVRYVLQNGPINTIAYGLPWKLSRSAVPYGPNGGALYEIFRSSWIAAPLVLGIAIIVAYTGNHSRKARFDILATASVGVLFLLLLTPYTMGRIDPGGPSRLGQLTMVAWEMITPLAVYPLCSMLSKVRFVAVAAFMCSTMYIWDAQSVFAVTQRSLAVPPLTDGAAVGLPALGRALTDPSHLDRLRRLKTSWTGYCLRGRLISTLPDEEGSISIWRGRSPLRSGRRIISCRLPSSGARWIVCRQNRLRLLCLRRKI